MFSAEAMAVLKARYLRENEIPADMFRRVANHVAQAEERYGEDTTVAAREFYQLLSELVFLPNSPTLINAGKERAQLAACFVLPVEDSLDGIFTTLKNAALIHQSGGGTGFAFSRVRQRGDLVSSTGGTASGPVSFMHVYDAATQVVKQGAARSGANMAILRVDHPDIEEFITAKRQSDSLNNFNLSVGITDRFMQAVEQDDCYELINPHNGQTARLAKARDIFALVVRMAWENGEPGLFFLDTVNRFNPTPELGEFEAPNPCSEQPLLPYESCVLGSINLTRFVTGTGMSREMDFSRLRSTVHTAVRFLDDTLDVNNYPLPEVTEASLRTRKIGLGVMGLAEVFIMLNIAYASQAAILLTGELLGLINREARLASEELGRRRGSFPAFAGSIPANEGWNAMRNATVTTIAPTGSISIIAGCSSGIEPLFALALSRRVLEGQVLASTNRVVAEYLRERNLLTEDVQVRIMREGSVQAAVLPDEAKQVLATAHEIPPYWHVAQLAAAQRYVDNGISKTVNMPATASEEDIARIFFQAYASGCKGVTVYRDASRDRQVLTGGTGACQDCCSGQ